MLSELRSGCASFEIDSGMLQESVGYSQPYRSNKTPTRDRIVDTLQKTFTRLERIEVGMSTTIPLEHHELGEMISSDLFAVSKRVRELIDAVLSGSYEALNMAFGRGEQV